MKNYLCPFVTEINDDGRKMEVIYISNDKTSEDFFDAFINTMQLGFALGFGAKKDSFIKKFSIKCVPALIVLTGDG